MILNWLEVGVVHSIPWSYSFGVVVLEHLREQIDRLVSDKLVVLRSNEFGPGLTWVSSDNVIVM